MSTVLETAFEVQEFLSSTGQRFCIIGGIAVPRWGEQRATRDVDVTLLCRLGDEPAAIDRLLSRFQARMEGAREFALRNRVLLLSSGGVGIDLSLGALPYEERCFGRASDWRIANRVLRTCSAEDLIVLKSFAARPQDWIDVESVVVRQRNKLDWNLVYSELEELSALKEGPDAMGALKAMQKRLA